MKQLVWALVVIGTVVTTRTVEADCGIPVWLGTAEQTALPVRGSVFVHHESLRYADASDPLPQPGVRWVGEAASIVRVEKVSDVVVRIDYDAPHTFAAVLYASSNDEWGPTHVTFDPGWTAPTTPPRVIQYWHEVSSWTCSSTDSLKLQVDQPTAAFRVRWTHDGKTREWIEAGRTWNDRTSLELGKINCGSETVDPAELAAGGHLELIAIRSDGSEVAVTGLPETISTREMPAGDGDRAMADAALVLFDRNPAVTASRSEPATTPGRTLGVIVIGLLLLGVALALRFRVRAPSSLP
ncbi:MAG: hypothetical protein JWP01_1178 [Myxococcales bacterium]|nr:hypothetical protein [Myxococcales bacterium]